jgi:uncharacterized protein
MKKLSKRFKILVVTIILLIVFCIWQNNSIVVSSSDYYSSKLPVDFNNFKIVQISDLHNKMFGEDQSKLLSQVESLLPDIIIVTGDLVDRRKFDLDIAMCFINDAVEIAPTYYVSGNHEAWSGKYLQITHRLMEAGVYIMDDTALELIKGSSTIQILGLSDPDFLTSDYLEGTNTSKLEEQLKQWSKSDKFKILLSHRPELFDLYRENNIDLIFSGHAHGGQFRIPFVGGLVAPDQGLFPQYTIGSYSNESSTMFVSRGLGNSIIPIRIFNRPEIVAVTLKSINERL